MSSYDLVISKTLGRIAHVWLGLSLEIDPKMKKLLHSMLSHLCYEFPGEEFIIYLPLKKIVPHASAQKLLDPPSAGQIILPQGLIFNNFSPTKVEGNGSLFTPGRI